jgi:ubiquinone/menaquinone biosynthesis C-methylase UbiE
MQNSSEIWDDLFSGGNFVWREPHELVVNLHSPLKKIGAESVLDLGCGAGRHLVFLSDLDFICYGIDIAFAGLEVAKTWLISEGFEVRLSQGEMHLLPYASCSFDAVVCLYVIYHGTVEKIKNALDEIYRVLKPGGLSLLTFISDQHHRYGKGREIESNTFITDVGADAGIPHHFYGREELVWMVRRFKIAEMKLLARVNKEGQLESHWAVRLGKPARQQK